MGPVNLALESPLGETSSAPLVRLAEQMFLRSIIFGMGQNTGEWHDFQTYRNSTFRTALMTGMATAQTATTTTTDASSNAATMHQEGEWRASKLVGVNVYNDANEKVGDINELIVDKSGKVTNVILGVGGFLGMGEHYVAVAYDKLKWVDEPVRSTVATTNAPGSTARNSDAR